MNNHRSRMKHNKQGLLYRHSHYDEKNLELSDFKIQPIEIFQSEISAEERIRKEEWWMRELKTLYPYGLNDKCGNSFYSDYKKDRTVFSVFNKIVIERKRREGKKLSLQGKCFNRKR